MTNSRDDADAPIIHEPTATASASVLWLHGLGADGNDFAPIVPYLGDLVTYTRFVFPNAPMRPVSINGGFVMRAWYDIAEGSGSEAGTLVSSLADIEASCASLADMVEKEIASGIASERIVLAGFSQGGVIAQHTALPFEHRLAGVMALSTYLPFPERISQSGIPANQDVPYFLAHGTYDPMIALDRAESSRDELVRLGCSLDWHTYPIEHSVSPEEISDIAAWLNSALPST
jgi:phospholipase/carboxylesterase